MKRWLIIIALLLFWAIVLVAFLSYPQPYGIIAVVLLPWCAYMVWKDKA
jgi:hypothetical protein